ncbi:type II secretion system ATPase GspE [Pseudoduganella namucuonensis]|uniref:Type II secretion system protein E n=1 Tax=Pseudoduganella namucuonensis TaxID=1035707 RepID=A0A1I7LKK9_9BURK|nr:type II secretion system ATPase GspE [Pseudoduganella namucuonensis]SFV10221.1 general secretion pathway protein E [Pseudoduganella namucuonensis]
MSNLLPYAFARDYAVLAKPGEQAEHAVDVFVSAATAPAAIAEVSRRFGRVNIRHLGRADLEEAIAAAYAGAGGDASQVADEFDADLDLTKLLQDVPAIEDLLESSDDAPVIRMINALLTQALREGASDIHIEPFEQTSVVRFRVDGALRDIVKPRKAIHGSLISRIKIMAQLDIAEKRLPQDGRITLRVGGKPVDVRVSTLPTGHGERAVLRLLDKEAGRLDLNHLGMSAAMLPRFDQLINQPHGIVLVTGPTGSGKTTTLYAALSMLNSTTTNILTVEDPIEYDLQGVGQTQVNARIDMTFAKALRAILRQDPDVIMIGEIRDLETAQIAVQASLTGHLVLATLHTNDAAAAVTRLLDMGIEPFLLSSSLLGVLAQRLVRKLCESCKKYDERDGQWHAVGCEQCGHTGYHGRVGIYELLQTTEPIRAQIHDRASEAEVRGAAQKDGMITMREDGERWLAQGVTTRAELLRVAKD